MDQVELRYYQEDALAAIKAAEERGVRKGLIVLPTGSGKTIIFSHIPDRLGEDSTPMLILAHREELLNQAKEKLQWANPHLDVAIEQGQNYAGHVDVVVASVPTLGRNGSPRLDGFPRDYFKTVVVDEAHHAAAPTYRRVLDHFDSALLVGVTATPKRGDNVGLAEVFEEIIYSRSLEDMIREGFLCDLAGYRYNSSVDLSQVKIVRGDYAEGELAKAVNTDARNEAVVESYLKYGVEDGRKALVFCVDVAHAKDMAESFRDAGIEAHAIWGAMPHDERRKTMEAHDRGDFPVLTNCQIATEGYDSPSIDMVIMARPTQSTSLYAQCVGRGTRLHPGKANCLVIDVADVSKTRRPVSLPSLLGLPSEFGLEGKTVTEAADKFRALADTSAYVTQYVKSFSDIDGAWEKINLFTPPPLNPELLEYSNLIWMEMGEDHYVLNFDRGDSITIKSDALGMWYVNQGEECLGYGEEMGNAFRFADSWAKEHKQDKLGFLKADAAWRGDPPSEKQIRILRKNGIPWEHLSKGQASQVIDKIFAANPRPPKPPWLTKKIEGEKLRSRDF
jgi:ATP-dependent helicase IRC3